MTEEKTIVRVEPQRFEAHADAIICRPPVNHYSDGSRHYGHRFVFCHLDPHVAEPEVAARWVAEVLTAASEPVTKLASGGEQ